MHTIKNARYPYVIQVYLKDGLRVIELRPRAGIWQPFTFSIPLRETDRVKPELYYGPKNNVPRKRELKGYNESQTQTGDLFTLHAHNAASVTHSYFIKCRKLPSKIIFGQEGSLFERNLKP